MPRHLHRHFLDRSLAYCEPAGVEVGLQTAAGAADRHDHPVVGAEAQRSFQAEQPAGSMVLLDLPWVS